VAEEDESLAPLQRGGGADNTAGKSDSLSGAWVGPLLKRSSRTPVALEASELATAVTAPLANENMPRMALAAAA